MGCSLLNWLEAPSKHHGIRFLGPGSGWRLHSYEELAQLARSAAAILADRGVGRGDVVCVVADTGPEFVACFFGALARGAVPSPVAPPLLTQKADAYQRHLSHILAAARPKAVLTTPDLAPRITAASPAGMCGPVLGVTAERLAARSHDGARAAPGETALLQFTSGSSGLPKGVVVPAAALEANIRVIRDWLEMTPEDPTASWLPVHHDMGLIGCLLTPVVNGSDLWAMRPLDFIQSPATWLACFGSAGARLTAVPNFGLGYVARKVAPEALAGMDFSGWRTVIVGAERIDPDVLQRFAELLAPQGFSARAFQPAYGLAEATLAVTGVPLRRPPATIAIDRCSLVPGDRVRTIPEPEAAGWRAMRIVGCGYPLGAASVRITGPDGEDLGDGHFGEILVEGPSVARGYLSAAGQPLVTAIDGGWLRTGDAGFLLAGELFVTGRLGDSIKRRARAVFAEDLEAVLLELPGMRRVRPVVLLGTHQGTDVAVVVAECAPGSWMDAAVQAIRLHAEEIPVTVCPVGRGTILRTSSGKPRRRPMWLSFVAGGLAGTAITGGPGG